jgi:hypothetical protein
MFSFFFLFVGILILNPLFAFTGGMCLIFVYTIFLLVFCTFFFVSFCFKSLGLMLLILIFELVYGDILYLLHKLAFSLFHAYVSHLKFIAYLNFLPLLLDSCVYFWLITFFFSGAPSIKYSWGFFDYFIFFGVFLYF